MSKRAAIGGRLRVGFIPSADFENRSLLREHFASEVGRALRVPADSHLSADYRGLVAALEQGVVHVAWVPPLIAAPAAIRKTILPVALAVRNGTTSYSAALITHRDSKIQTPSDLREARAAWVDRESASGYTVIRMALRARGISLVDAFGEEVFARSHAEVARLVVTRQVDVGATYFSSEKNMGPIARAGWLRVEGVPEEQIRVVAEAGPIPSDFFAVHKGLPPEQVDALRTALLDGRPEGVLRIAKRLLRTDGFMSPTPEHQVMLQKLMETMTRAGPSIPPRA